MSPALLASTPTAQEIHKIFDSRFTRLPFEKWLDRHDPKQGYKLSAVSKLVVVTDAHGIEYWRILVTWTRGC